jgi:hypothetical protein
VLSQLAWTVVIRVMKLCVQGLMSACNRRGGGANSIMNIKNFVNDSVTITRTAVAVVSHANYLPGQIIMQHDRDFTDVIQLYLCLDYQASHP